MKVLFLEGVIGGGKRRMIEHLKADGWVEYSATRYADGRPHLAWLHIEESGPWAMDFLDQLDKQWGRRTPLKVVVNRSLISSYVYGGVDRLDWFKGMLLRHPDWRLAVIVTRETPGFEVEDRHGISHATEDFRYAEAIERIGIAEKLVEWEDTLATDEWYECRGEHEK